LQYQQRARKLWSVHPIIYNLLKDADSPIVSRNFILSYITETRRHLNRISQQIRPLEFNLQNQCLLILRNIISVRSERISKFSLIRLLWGLAHENENIIPPDINDGFFDEMHHLFLGTLGKSGIYDHESYPEFADIHGREASVILSRQLDQIAERSQNTIQRYPSGLESNIIQNRLKNRRRILTRLGGSERDWKDYMWHLKHVIRTSDDLARLVEITEDEKNAIDRARQARLPFGITPYYASLMDEKPHRRRDHAVRAQVIPPMDYVNTMIANRAGDASSFDFMLEHDTSPIDLITRRYPHIVILKPYNTCAQICVYCQRNWEINDVLTPGAMAGKEKINRAVAWIRDHRAITEVLVTGGDPLIMKDDPVKNILAKLADIGHVERIRIGSRTPVVLPQRITDGLIDTISAFHVPGRREITLVTHFEHPYEVTPESMEAVQKFRRTGMSVYNQGVFTIENSRRFEAVALRKTLRMIGVDLYYTFNMKGKEETNKYRAPLARLQQEISEESRLMPGLIRTDEPVYNVPGLGKNYIRAQQDHSLLTILPDGRRVYEFHPWMKKLALVETYIDTDVSISKYLKELKNRGENPEDYKTIWYYF